MRNREIPRVVVVGAGSIARRFHLPALAYLSARKRCRLSAICDLNTAAAGQAARAFGFTKAYSDLDAMLDAERPDGVVVLTTVEATAQVAGLTLRRGLPTLLEKPPGKTPAECRQLINAARAGKAPNLVAFNRRFHPHIVQAKNWMAKASSATTGASAQMFRVNRVDDPFFSETGIHALDALRFLAGEMDAVRTSIHRSPGTRQPAFLLNIEYSSGGFGTLEVRPETGVSLERYHLFSGGATALVDAGIGGWIDQPGTCSAYLAGKPVRLPDALKPYRALRGPRRNAACGGFLGEEEAFIEWLWTGRYAGPTIEQSLASVEIAHRAQAGRIWKR